MGVTDSLHLPVIGVGVSLYFAFRFLQFLKQIWRESLWSETFPIKKFGNWAAVTGSSDGIGKAVAYELAKYGMNVVLISRTRVKLEKLAAELENEFSIQTKCIAVDFTSEEIYDHIQEEMKDLDIAVLVNNVGMVRVEPTALLDVPDMQTYSTNLCRVNVYAMTKLTQLILPEMVKGGGGIVANVSSILGTNSSPYMSVYGATKSLNIKLTKALHDEYKGSGVIFQCFVPGITITSGVKAKPSFLIPTAAEYGKYFIKALGKSEHTNTSLFGHNLFQIILKLLPGFLIAKAFKSGAEKEILGREKFRKNAPYTIETNRTIPEETTRYE